MRNLKTRFILLWLLFGLSACSTTFVAPFNPEVRSMLVRYSVEVDSFWQQLKEDPVEQRQFIHYEKDYNDIEKNLKILLKLNQMRAQNEESSQQTENLLKLWQQDKTSHKEKDSFKDFLLKRRVKEYQRIFSAMLIAEDAKNI